MTWFVEWMDSVIIELRGDTQDQWNNSYKRYDYSEFRHKLLTEPDPSGQRYQINEEDCDIFTHIVSYPLTVDVPLAAYAKMVQLYDCSFLPQRFFIKEMEVVYSDDVIARIYGLRGNVTERTYYSENISLRQKNGIPLIELPRLRGCNYDIMERDFGFDEITKIKYLTTGLSQGLFELD